MSVFADQIQNTEDRFKRFKAQRERGLTLIRDKKFFQADTPERVASWFKRRGFSPHVADRAIREGLMLPETADLFTGSTDDVGLERIIGTTDYLGVAFLERGLNVSKTVARVSIGGAKGQPIGYGTGFMVSPRLLLTNNHVLPNEFTAAGSCAEFNYYVQQDGRPSAVTVFALQPEIFFATDINLDFTLVAVSAIGQGREQLEEFGWNKLDPAEGKAIVGQWVNIVQHPNGEPKQLVLRNNQIVSAADAFLQYVADTSPGSSGSPVFNDRWEVVALHHSGVPARDAQRRILNIDGKPWNRIEGEQRIKWVANEGVRVSRLVAHLDSLPLAGNKKAMFRELLGSRSPSANNPRDAANVPTSPTIIIGDQMKNQDNSSASWTIPIQVTVRVGGTAPDVGPAPPPIIAAPDITGHPFDEQSLLASARRELERRPDVIGVRMGYKFKDGWITSERAIVVKVLEKRSVHELGKAGISLLPSTFGGYPVQVTGPCLADLVSQSMGSSLETLKGVAGLKTQEITYTKPKLPLSTVNEKMTANLHVSPDAGWPNLNKFLRGAKDKLVIGMYDFGAPHIVEAIEAIKTPAFKELVLTLQKGESVGGGTKADDLTDEEVVDRLHKRFGSKLKFGWIRIGVKNGWVASSYHIKVAVRDGNAFWLSSGNWQSSNQPPEDLVGTQSTDFSYLKNYNREWHAIIENTSLAKMYESYLRYDLTDGADPAFDEAFANLPVLQIPSLEAAFQKPAGRNYQYFAPLLLRDKKLKVTPLLTPDNYFDALIDLLKGAKEEIILQNQTFNAPKEGNERLQEVMDILLSKQKRMPVRIVYRILIASNARENLEGLKDLGFDTNNIKVQPNCHTKGIIVDGEKLLLGSQNISEQGISVNRDASLLFESKEIAGYFKAIFEHDWENLAQQYIGSDLEAAWSEGAKRGVASKEGSRILTPKEYLALL